MDFKFTEENIGKINLILQRYPEKKAAVMPVLYLGQEQNGGWISDDVVKTVAEILEITEEEVMGVVTFYTMYHQKPVGKYHIQFCTNVSCMLRGAYPIWESIKDKLQIDNGGVTGDGKFSLEEVECMGSCGTAPMMAINEDFFENLTKEEALRIIESLK